MKQDKRIMDEKVSEIGQTAVECLNGREFNRLVVGFITENFRDSVIKKMEVFYEDSEGRPVYFNKLIYDESFNDSLEEQKYLDLQDLLADLREYCASCGDEWKCMTLTINKDGGFKINFDYEPITVKDWRKQNNLA